MRILKIPRLFKLFKLGRIVRIQKMLKGTELYLFVKLNSGLIKTAVVFLGTLIGLHLVACLFLAIPSLEDDDRLTWIYRHKLQNLSNEALYLQAFYFCLTTLTTVGYGDITVRTKSRTILTSRNFVLRVLDDHRGGLLLHDYRYHLCFLHEQRRPQISCKEKAPNSRGFLPEFRD